VYLYIVGGILLGIQQFVEIVTERKIKNPNEVACWNEKEEEGMSLCVGFMTAAGLRQSGFSLLCAVVCVLSGGHPVSVRMRAPRKTKIGRGKWKKLPPRAYYPVSPLPPSSV
jgi:hypothetical protein